MKFKFHQALKPIHEAMKKILNGYIHRHNGLSQYYFWRSLRGDTLYHRVVCLHVAYYENKIIGWAAAFERTDTKERKVELHVYVSESYRRNGIGRQLVSRIMDKYKIKFSVCMDSAMDFWENFSDQTKDVHD